MTIIIGIKTKAIPPIKRKGLKENSTYFPKNACDIPPKKPPLQTVKNSCKGSCVNKVVHKTKIGFKLNLIIN